MPALSTITGVFRTLFRRTRLDRDLDEELHGYVEALTEQKIEAGLDPAAARRQALIEAGGVEQVKEAVREIRPGAWIETTLGDLRQAWRLLRRTPGFAAVAVVTLGLGIGANTAIFSVVRAVLLRPLPYAEPERLVFVWDTSRQQPRENLSPGRLVDLRQSPVFAGVAGVAHVPLNLSDGDTPERLYGASVSTNFFEVLGVKAAVGGTFGGGDLQRGAVIAHGLWTRRFAGDPAIVGRRILLDRTPYTVIGVMPPGFVWPTIVTAGARMPAPEIWLPAPIRDVPALATGDGSYVESRRMGYLRAVARLRPGVAADAVNTELATLARDLAARHPDTDGGRGLVAVPAMTQVTGEFRTPLLVLLGAVGLVLAIACVNVANLLLVRTAARHGEIAMRAALGAGRGRLARQFLVESLLLTALGAALGVVLAHWSLSALLALSPAEMVRLEDTRLDPIVLLFSAALGLATGAVLALVPLLQSRRMMTALTAAGRGATKRSRGLRGGLLLVSEVAIAVALVLGATLLVRSFVALQQVAVGIDSPESVLTFDLFLNGGRDRTPAQQVATFERALERVAALPGVRQAGAAVTLPVGGDDFGTPVWVEGEAAPVPGQEGRVGLQVVTPGFFTTLGIPVLSGRDVNASDRADATRVALVNQAFARQHWPGRDPLGRRFRSGMRPDLPWITVVGVVRDIRHLGPAEPARAEIYLPLWQRPFPFMAVVVRTEGDPMALVPSVRSAIAALDPQQPISGVSTMDRHLRNAVAEPRFLAALVSLFGGLALLLAAIGVYGVMAWSVTERRREIGTRLALGATSRDILRMVVGQGGRVVAAGMILGTALAVAQAYLLRSLLHGVPPSDGRSYATSLCLLAVVAVVALWLPARRASRTDAALVLRN